MARLLIDLSLLVIISACIFGLDLIVIGPARRFHTANTNYHGGAAQVAYALAAVTSRSAPDSD